MARDMTSPPIDLTYPLVARAAERAGVRAVFIKGPFLQQQGLRSDVRSVDVDVWVSPDEIDRFLADLAQLGWHPFHDLRTHAVTLRHDRLGHELDLHRAFPGIRLADQASFELLWDARETAVVAGHEVFVPSVAAHTVISALHLMRAPMGGPQGREQRRIQEWDELVQATPISRLDEIRDLAQQWRAVDALEPFLRQVSTGEPTELPGAEAWPADLVIRDGASAWVGQLLDVPWAEKAAVLKSALWPAPAAIRQDDEKHGRPPRALPWARARRGVRGSARALVALDVRTQMRGAMRLVWSVDPRDAWLSGAAQSVRVLLLLGFVWASAHAVTGVVQAQRSSVTQTLLVPVSILAVLAAVTAALGVAQTQRERMLDEKVNRAVWARILDVTTSVDRAHYDAPDFAQQLDRIVVNVFGKPVDMARAVFSSIGALCGAAAMTIILVWVDALVVLPLAVAAVPALACSVAASRAEYRYNRTVQPVRQRLAYLRELMEYKDHASEIRAFQATDHLRAKHELLADQHGRMLAAVVRLQRRFGVLGAVVSGLGLLGVVLVLARQIQVGAVTVAAAGAAVVAARLLGAELTRCLSSLSAFTAAAPFLRELAEFEVRFGRAKARHDRLPLRDGIELVDVTYTHPGMTRPAVDGVSIRLAAGETVALVGENGSGKSTLAAIIAGLYVSPTGEYRWDGAALADPRQARASVACLFQDFGRYHFTAGENIAFGDTGRTPAEADLYEAARQAGAEDIVEGLPHGLSTPLGNILEPGSDLSTGEWQRLALARTLFRDAPCVILDEPMAALDPKAEAALVRDLRSTLRGRTGLMITHRYATARHADRICVMHEGRIVESGTHDELMAHGARYAELYALQADQGV
jgi:ATP-binding cassette subfamily B protein